MFQFRLLILNRDSTHNQSIITSNNFLKSFALKFLLGHYKVPHTSLTVRVAVNWAGGKYNLVSTDSSAVDAFSTYSMLKSPVLDKHLTPVCPHLCSVFIILLTIVCH